jgi:hypothetical protein
LMTVWTDVLGELLDGMDDRTVEYVLPPILFFPFSFTPPFTSPFHINLV